ncbi:hypothetical protein GRF29_161g530307 [Pseudopithomyces chartarum]|uniref:Uncharacterized protein n=1 Tax=Pseudopithomyces chartarum TaxID=1892770 RepID=A0AAN6LRX4_9PLEO|nr:hypothetical protein GRF29_161g530307 [Pseudopithomyces chartarum]
MLIGFVKSYVEPLVARFLDSASWVTLPRSRFLGLLDGMLVYLVYGLIFPHVNLANTLKCFVFFVEGAMINAFGFALLLFLAHTPSDIKFFTERIRAHGSNTASTKNDSETMRKSTGIGCVALFSRLPRFLHRSFSSPLLVNLPLLFILASNTLLHELQRRIYEAVYRTADHRRILRCAIRRLCERKTTPAWPTPAGCIYGRDRWLCDAYRERDHRLVDEEEEILVYQHPRFEYAI